MDEYVVGAIAGMAGLVFGHPLDTTKVQMQTRVSVPYRNTMEAMKAISINGWKNGFLRGMSFPLFSYSVVNSVLFGSYGLVLGAIRGRSHTAECAATSGQLVAAGCIAGALQLLVACPVDVVKVIMQSQIKKDISSTKTPTQPYFISATACIQHQFKHGGLKNCYRGLGIMAIRDLPAYSVYFSLYEYFTVKLTRVCENRFFSSLVSGGIAGMVSWGVIFPLDVVKSHIQASSITSKQTASAWAHSKEIYARGGVKAFGAGLLPCLLRAFLVNAVIFATHHELINYTRSTDASKRTENEAYAFDS